MITPDSIKSPNLKQYVGNIDALIAVLGNIQESVYVYDPRTHASVYSNRSILHLLGYDEAKIKELGTMWTKLIVHPDDLIFLTKHLTNLSLLEPGKRSRVAYRAKDVTGKWRMVESAGVMLTDADGKAAQVFGSTSLVADVPADMTEQIHDHRCANCSKLLGKEKINHAVVEVKCGRCGEYNDLTVE